MVSPRSTLVSIVLVLAVLLSVTGCEEEEIPEHIKQQQLEARERAELKKAAEDKPKLEEETWPEPVQAAYYRASIATGSAVPLALEALAQLGPDAAPALRMIATNPRHPKEKRAAASLLVPDLYLFQPDELVRLAQESQLTLVRHRAIALLARFGTSASQDALSSLEKSLRVQAQSIAEAAQRARAKMGPELEQRLSLADFIAKTRQDTTSWSYSADQLKTLARIQRADSPAELLEAVGDIKDLSLEQGLIALLKSPAISAPKKDAVAIKMMELASPERMMGYTDEHYPPLMRISAARELLKRGKPEHRKQLERMSRLPEDPFAMVLREMLGGAAPAPKR